MGKRGKWIGNPIVDKPCKICGTIFSVREAGLRTVYARVRRGAVCCSSECSAENKRRIHSAAGNAWKKRHPEKARQYSRNTYLNTREKRLAYSRQYRAAHLEYYEAKKVESRQRRRDEHAYARMQSGRMALFTGQGLPE